MRFARGAGLWIFWCRMSMTLDIYFAGFCRGFWPVGFWIPVSGAKTHHKTAEALGQVTWCGQWTPWSPRRAEEDLVKKTHSHHFENLPYNRTKNCLVPGIKMHKSLRYQKAQQEMVDIQHFNQQEREDCQNCKTSLPYCRTSAVVSGKAIPTNGLVNRSLLDVPSQHWLSLFPPTQFLEDYPCLWKSGPRRTCCPWSVSFAKPWSSRFAQQNLLSFFKGWDISMDNL